MPFYGLHRSFILRVPGKDIVTHPEYIIGESEAQVKEAELNFKSALLLAFLREIIARSGRDWALSWRASYLRRL